MVGQTLSKVGGNDFSLRATMYEHATVVIGAAVVICALVVADKMQKPAVASTQKKKL